MKDSIKLHRCVIAMRDHRYAEKSTSVVCSAALQFVSHLSIRFESKALDFEPDHHYKHMADIVDFIYSKILLLAQPIIMTTSQLKALSKIGP